MTRTGYRRRIYRAILFAATIVAVAFFVRANASKLSEHAARLDTGGLLLCLLFVVSGYLARFGAWTRLASRFELHAPTLVAARAYFISILGRYIPGKVGLALIRIEAYRPLPPERVALATGVELVSAISAALILMTAGLVSSTVSLPSWMLWAAPAGIAATLLILSPPFLHRVAAAVFRLTGRERPETLPGFAAMLRLTILYIVPGLLQGLGLYTLLRSMGPLPEGSYLAVTGAYYTAGLAGMLAVFAPGGLGVREGILMLVLPLVVPKETAIVAALALRLVMTAAEIVLAGTFSALASLRRG